MEWGGRCEGVPTWSGVGGVKVQLHGVGREVEGAISPSPMAEVSITHIKLSPATTYTCTYEQMYVRICIHVHIHCTV